MPSNETLAARAAAEITKEIEAAYRRELHQLSDFAFAFLNATDGDRSEAVLFQRPVLGWKQSLSNKGG
jgi:hypothetical protein